MGVFHCAVLLLHGILTSVHGEFAVIVPGDGGFAATVGGDAVLECQLVPDILTSDMEVQWRKSGLASPVLVYRHGESDAHAQHQDYRARAQLFKDELAKGNISLRIMNVRRLDEGEYTCSVTDGTENEASPAQLRVQGLGSKPQIQLLGFQGDGIQLVCKSGGWYPGPKMVWIGEDGQVLPQAETRYHEDTEGLINVESNVTVTRQSTNKFKCVVRYRRLNIQHEAIVKISDEIFPAGVPDWVLPLVLTICLLIAANGAVFYWNVKQNRRIKELERRKSTVEHEWKRIRGHQVSVTLDAGTAHPRLEVSEDRKRVRRTGTVRSLPDTGKRFTVRPCVLGSEGFTSGRHYWEVEVAGSEVWSLGVAAESVERKREFTLTPETGVWSIRRWYDQFVALTYSPSPLPARPIPGWVGVYLSYESGTVSFYDAGTKSHLHTFTGNKFTEKCYPFFVPWEDKWLRICSGSIPGYEDVQRAYVSVTLDVETAHPRLEVSEDRKRVRWTGTERSLPDTGKRFTVSPCVLGSEGFTSGRHYWEVEVAGSRYWSLGVAAESVKREGGVTLTPETGVWSIERWGDMFDAVTSPPSRLPARPIPGRVGVYLSYESGTVSFYDAGTKSHLHTFTGNKFTGKCYPFFWTLDDDKWMTICSGSAPGV
ncbi:butyrophilin subfamily 1 member A1-like [Rhinoraja longicauda]